MSQALETLGKWRKLLAGWQLGTRPNDDPEAAAVRDQREAQLVMRAEISALANLLIKKGVFTADEYQAQMDLEATELCKAFETYWKGFKATPVGLEMSMPEAGETMRRHHFKP